MNHQQNPEHISQITPVLLGIIRARNLEQISDITVFCYWCGKYLQGNHYSCPHCDRTI